jgi:hypothetical protein
MKKLLLAGVLSVLFLPPLAVIASVVRDPSPPFLFY